jgi:hypothetical protein
MRNSSPERLTSPQPRSLESLTGVHLIRVSEYGSKAQNSDRFTTCTAPFLACRNSIMHDECGFARCNSPFQYCKRYQLDAP